MTGVLLPVVPDQQIRQGAAATLRYLYLDGNGKAATAGHSIAVTVVNSAGTTVASGTATDATATTAGLYTFAFTGTTSLDVLTVSWNDNTFTHTTVVEIVGDYLFTLGQATAVESLADTDDQTLIDKRLIVSAEVEWICDRAFTPRARTVIVDGTNTGQIGIPSNDMGSSHDLRTITAASVGGVALTSPQLSSLIIRDQVIEWPFGSIWTTGQANVSISYTYGLDNPTVDLVDALLVRLRQRVNRPLNGIPDRATSIQIDQLGTMKLDTASRYKTGYPEVDAVYERWSNRVTDGGAAPAFGFVSYNPQWPSLYHSGTRWDR